MKKIIINNEIWQTRIAVLSENKLQDLYFDVASKTDLDRCFFKGRISKVLPGIQTAFVDIGQQKSGFLHITEVDRELASEKIFAGVQTDEDQDKPKERIPRASLNISKIFKENDDVLVQVIKEPIHEKGPKLTTCFTLPGKFIVLMPNIPQIGISRKIEDREERARLKEVLSHILPKGMGAIVRTTAESRKTADLKRDIGFLVATWNSIMKKFKKAQPGTKVHEDIPLSLRVVRDQLDEDVEMVLTDNQKDLQGISKFVKSFTPELADKVQLYTEDTPIFDKFNLEKQIASALQKKVSLKSGGSLIIESTEAMTVIDVNTGKFIGSNSHEETILQTNLEAADEIVTQLRLRNIGGLIVIDFIDMAVSSNRQRLSRFLEKTLKERDKYQSVTLRISEFGIVQMTRKRSGKTLTQQLTTNCLTCHGLGFVKSTSAIGFEILHQIQLKLALKPAQGSLTLSLAPTIYDYLIQYEYKSILQIEKDLNCKITLEKNDKNEGAQFQLLPAK